MGEKRFSPVEKILHRAEDHIEEWRRRNQAQKAEVEADSDSLWAEAKEREKLLTEAAREEQSHCRGPSRWLPGGTTSSSSSMRKRKRGRSKPSRARGIG
jgi:hypothetical protein